MTGALATVPPAVEDIRAALTAAMRVAVDRLPPAIAGVVQYHLGWRDAEGRITGSDGGKAVRPAIVLLAARAVGGTTEGAMPGAVALELVHNYSLIHDDVMDGDRERRHRPTVWAVFGIPRAIVAGDALVALAHELLLELPSAAGSRAALELTRATAEMIAGQDDDLAFEARGDVTVEECVTMCGRKTGALLACAGVLGAVLGGGDQAAVEALRTFGANVGLAFQAVDDVLGVWGRPEVTGKPAASDLRQRKKTLPVAHALTTATGPELAEVLRSGDLGNGSMDRAVALLDRAGSRAWSEDLAARHLHAAVGALDGAGLLEKPAAALRQVAEFVVGRNF
jgi:geranylgeranyl diphosphate synthase type I